VLAALFLRADNDTGRDVRETDRAVSGVDVLASRAGTTALLVVLIMVAVNAYVLDSFAQLSSLSTADAGMALDPDAVTRILSGCRTRTERPLIAKLAPNDAVIDETAERAVEAGADALTLTNTLPGLLVDARTGDAELGGGGGGVSGPALRPAGLRAVRAVRPVVDVPLFGVGGVLGPADAVAYARAGADVVQIGTATFAAPRAANLLVSGLRRWGRRHGVDAWSDLVDRAPGAVS